jgi:hypothetical protein
MWSLTNLVHGSSTPLQVVSNWLFRVHTLNMLVDRFKLLQVLPALGHWLYRNLRLWLELLLQRWTAQRWVWAHNLLLRTPYFFKAFAFQVCWHWALPCFVGIPKLGSLLLGLIKVIFSRSGILQSLQDLGIIFDPPHPDRRPVHLITPAGHQIAVLFTLLWIIGLQMQACLALYLYCWWVYVSRHLVFVIINSSILLQRHLFACRYWLQLWNRHALNRATHTYLGNTEVLR